MNAVKKQGVINNGFELEEEYYSKNSKENKEKLDRVAKTIIESEEDTEMTISGNFNKKTEVESKKFDNTDIQDDGEFRRRFAGALFTSLRERNVHGWLTSNEYSFQYVGSRKDSVPSLSRSQYSLVSCGDVTPAAMELWLGLPEEVKFDPALAPFRRYYEKEHGAVDNTQRPHRNGTPKKRLPYVASAPHLHNNQNSNLHTVAEEDTFRNNNNDLGIEIPAWKQDKIQEKEATEDGGSQKKKSMFVQAGHLTKITLLLACWMFFTVVFMTYNEREEVLKQSFITPGEVKDYTLHDSSSKFSVLVKLTGPFLTREAEQKMNATEYEESSFLEVWLEQWTLNTTSKDMKGIDALKAETAKKWRIIIENDEDLDFFEGETRKSVLHYESIENGPSVYALRMLTSANKTMPFSISYTKNPLDQNSGVIYSALLLCGLYILIIFEVINRTMAAVLVSTTALAVLSMVGERPSLPELVSWLDVETLLLLFSMMLLVAIMAETGMFDFVAVYTFEKTKGKMWPLINTLCVITAVLSTFLDNVTTVLLMTPVTIRLCEVMELDPVPILMSMVLYSNIGGTATPVGDPPNVIIASNKDVIASGINFTNFTMHMTFGILLVCVQTYFQLQFMFRDTDQLRLKVPSEIQELRQQLTIWRRAADSLPHLSKDEHVVRERLERKIKKLNVQLEARVKERTKRACPKDTFQSTLDEMKAKYKIRDKALLVKATIAITFVVAVFFLHSIPEFNRVSLAWTALLGAILLLILADREDLEPILHRVEWSTLLFFAALFVLMEALSKLGLIDFIGGLTKDLIMAVDERYRMAVALLLMLWVSGVSSAFVDNIPLTTMMVRVVAALGSNPALGLPMAPLIWALSFGACLGGNGTLIGASANVVCAGVAEQHGYKFSFMQFFKIGFPVMIGHLIVASGYLMFCHVLFEWH